MDRWMNERMDKREVPLCSTGLRPPWDRCPASPQTFHNSSSRARESLTTSCPGQPVHFFFLHFPSRFFFTAPAQSSATNVVVYAVLPTAPALHFTAPAQPPRLMPVCVSGLVIIFQEYLNSRKSITWSAVPITPAQLVAWEEKLGQQPQRG